VLVLRRRYVDVKFTLWRGSWNRDWELAHLWRWLRRDRRWLVEVFNGIKEDPGRTPEREASRSWVCSDLAAACTLAERLCRGLETEGAKAMYRTAEELLRST
jgi:hypothetical protein